MLPLAGIAAWEALVTVGKIKAGQRVLIHAAAGGVGSLTVQIAKSYGAHVIATASGKHRSLVESLGADEFINYQTTRLATAATNVDLVFDTMGGDTQDASWQVMAPDGLMVSIASDTTAGAALHPGLRGKFLFIQPNALVLDQLAAMVDSGKLRPLVCAEFALQDIAKAHALSETGHAVGKIAIYVGYP